MKPEEQHAQHGNAEQAHFCKQHRSNIHEHLPFPGKTAEIPLYDYVLRLRSPLPVCKSQPMHDSQIITCF